MAAVPPDQLGAATDPIVLRESRLWPNALFGGLLLVFVLVLSRGLAGAQTAGGRIAVAVIFVAAIALAAWAWVMVVIRRRGRLEITGQTITYTDRKTQPVTLSRQQGELLRVVDMGSPRYPKRCLTVPGTSTVIPLNLFRLSEVRQACAARGWQF